MAKKNAMIVPETLWQMCEELTTITERIIANGGEIEEGDIEALAEWNATIEAKAENVAFFAESNKGRIEYYKAIEDAAKARRKACENAVKGVKRYLKTCMESADIKQIKKLDGLFTISLCPGRVTPHIENPDKLPMDLVDMVTVYKPRLKDIKDRLEKGEEISGASLEHGENYIRILGGKK